MFTKLISTLLIVFCLFSYFKCFGFIQIIIFRRQWNVCGRILERIHLESFINRFYTLLKEKNLYLSILTWKFCRSFNLRMKIYSFTFVMLGMRDFSSIKKSHDSRNTILGLNPRPTQHFDLVKILKILFWTAKPQTL